MYIAVVDLMLILWALKQFGALKSETTFRKLNLTTSFSQFKGYLVPSIAIGFLSQDWRSEFLNQSRLWRSQVWDLRRFLFSSAQSLFSFFWIFLSFSLFYEISSYVVVLLALVLLVGRYLISKIAGPQATIYKMVSSLSPIIFFSLVLFFLELAFRNSTILMQFLMESEIVFFTTIDSVFNLLALLALSMIVGYCVPIQGWSLVLTFVFFLNSQLSYLGFVYIIVGELLGTAVYLFRRVRQWDSFYQKRVKGLLLWVLAYLVFFLVAIYLLRQFMNFGNIFSQVFVLKWIYLSTVLFLLAGLYVTVMIWGHYAHADRDKDVSPSDSSLVKDFASLEMDSVSLFILDQFRLRKQKLIDFKIEMDKEPHNRDKIPPFVLSRLQAETDVIEKLLSQRS